ncbi:hypothetical protein BYZ73_02325 [Rhodovulum viride]|uniref:Exopolysaccharide production repressor protein n=1 Tax=Rhodovulum viride TaxID=1231134 RepID=A0ABX9DKU8_9RHOB|nr:hypothetical protein [Rhodovulum viride]RAP43032.1 hypothetical protein BYZ73_02325 [Rhodovulum viride]
MKAIRQIPPFFLMIFGVGILLNLIVLTGLSHAAILVILQLFATLAMCAALYALIIRHFMTRIGGVPTSGAANVSPDHSGEAEPGTESEAAPNRDGHAAH